MGHENGSDPAIDEVLSSWFETLRPEQWFERDAAVDDRCREFLPLYERLVTDGTSEWEVNADGCLAAVIVLDQFPRNIFRSDPRAYGADAAALALAARAIDAGLDQALDLERRKFLYMPYQHSEDPAVQARSVELFESLDDLQNVEYAKRHQEIVARFGRFPHRNQVLGRESTAEEIEFLKEPDSSF